MHDALAILVDQCARISGGWFSFGKLYHTICEHASPAASLQAHNERTQQAIAVALDLGFRPGDQGPCGYRFWSEDCRESILGRFAQDWQSYEKDVSETKLGWVPRCYFGRAELDDIAIRTVMLRQVDWAAQLAGEQWFGIREVAAGAAYGCGITDENEIKRLTLAAAPVLLKCGWRAGERTSVGYRFWPETQIADIIERLDATWPDFDQFVGSDRHPVYFGRKEHDATAEELWISEEIEGLVDESRDDVVAFFAFAGRAEQRIARDDPVDVRRLTLALVSKAVDRGLQPVPSPYFENDPIRFPWLRAPAASVVDCIGREWTSGLERQDFGWKCWFGREATP